jgi:fumarate hydratase class II
MIAVQVMANDVAVGFGGAGGYLDSNLPLSTKQSSKLLDQRLTTLARPCSQDLCVGRVNRCRARYALAIAAPAICS